MLRKIETDLLEVRDALIGARGGWKAVMLFGSCASAVGAAVLACLGWLPR
ncbi:MAG TPA: hypothetical protein VHG92_07350 [Afifellaceae bacterium]|nr:hypothetical protein [Afifellaceae bacterium]